MLDSDPPNQGCHIPVNNVTEKVETYRAHLLETPNDPWKLQHVSREPLGHKQVLVKVTACGVCGTDAAAANGLLGDMVKWPTVLGHEIVGNVVEVGRDVTQWGVGDYVGGAWHGGHDGTCKQCRQGGFQGCDNEVINGISKPGGYEVAEYCVLNSEAVVRIPEEWDPVQAAPFLCAGMTVFNSIRHQNLQPGETVAIQGIGGLGHLGIQYARKMGFRVVAISSGDAKRALATELGAHDYINASCEDIGKALQLLGGAKLILMTAPNPQTIGTFVKGLAWHGKLLTVTPVGEVLVDTEYLVSRSCSVQGWNSGHAWDCEDALQFAKMHDIKCMVEPFAIEDMHSAMKRMLSGEVRFRAVIQM